jgi:hypothetical protein
LGSSGAIGKEDQGPDAGATVHGPLRQAWWLQPHAAEELAELLALGVVKAEAIPSEDV